MVEESAKQEATTVDESAYHGAAEEAPLDKASAVEEVAQREAF